MRHDALTGLPNRGVFLERLNAALAGGRRGDRMTAVLCLDLADFKAVNDTLGYAAGDLLLRHMSARLLATLRETDTLARMGPDEFAIIQADIEAPAGAARLCERLLTSMEEPFDLFGEATHVRANIGVALSPTDTRDPEQLLKQAGLALTRAKAEGAQTFRFFEGAMDSELRERKALEQDLHHALQRGELELHYQPQIDLRDAHHGRGRGAAALASSQARPDPARPLHPARRGHRPDPADRRLGAGAGLPARPGDWQRAGLPQLRMSVNLSPVQFRDPELAGVVRSALERSGLAPDRLELEITERALMEDTETNLAILRELKQLGVKISIDDFGVGHSSLGYLRRFAFDEIKLDRSFVAALEHDPSAAAIVRATLEPRSQPRPRRGRRGRRERRAAGDARCRGLQAGAGLLFQPAGARAGDRQHGQGAGRGQAGCRRSERLTGWPRGCSAAQALLAGAGNHFQPAGAVAGDRRGGVRDGPGIGGAVGQRGAETDGRRGWLARRRATMPARRCRSGKPARQAPGEGPRGR